MKKICPPPAEALRISPLFEVRFFHCIKKSPLINSTRFSVFRLHFGFFDTVIKIKNVSLYGPQLLTIKYFSKSEKGAIKTQNSSFPDSQNMAVRTGPKNTNFAFLWHPFHFLGNILWSKVEARKAKHF